MKYSGIINIIDDQGEVAYERELSQDAIIEELLMSAPKRIEAPTEAASVAAVLQEVHTVLEDEPPIVLQSFKKGLVPDGPPVTVPRKPGQKVCKACSKPGHMQKTCPDRIAPPVPVAEEDVPETAPPGSHDVVNMTPMSKQQFEQLKEFQLDEKEAADIALEIGWDDLDDVSVAMKSNSYFVYTFDRKKTLAKRMRKG